MLAIVIPYFKYAFFEETLISLVNQTDSNFNVYIGDDSSEDPPDDLIAKYYDSLNLTYVRFNDNLGSIALTKQWERCIRLVKDEEWIMVLGDDDKLEPDVISLWYNHYNDFKDVTNVVRFSTQKIDEKSIPYSKKFHHPTFEQPYDSYFRRFKGKTRSSLSEYIFKRDSFLKFKFYNYPLGWHSDDRAWLEFSQGLPIYSINGASALIRVSPLSISGSQTNSREKRIATLQFYNFLVFKKLWLFRTSQRIYIVRGLKDHLIRNEQFTFINRLKIWMIYLLFFKKQTALKMVKKLN